MTFAFAIFLERILDCHSFVHEELAVHGLDSGVGGFKIGVGDETVALRLARLWVARDLLVEHEQ